MHINLLRSARREHENNQRRLERCENRISELDQYSGTGLILKQEKYYNGIDLKTKKRSYLKLEDKSIEGIQELRYWQEIEKRIIKNQEELTRFSNNYTPLSRNEVLQSLPKAYRPRGEKLGKLYSYEDPRVEEWMQKKLAARDAVQRKHPEHLTVRTVTGECVRSKSEASYYEMLYFLGIPFVYESPIYLNGRRYDPDFTLLRLVDFNDVYHEHAGLLTNSGYAADFTDKLNTYSQNGIYSPHNLIITTEGTNGDFDLFYYQDMLKLILQIEEW